MLHIFILQFIFTQLVCIVLIYITHDLLQIPPADLEAVLILHPEIVDVAVTG